MNRLIFVLLAAALVAATISLSTLLGARSGPESPFHIKTDENIVLFSVTPWGDARQAKEAYRPLLAFLSEKTGKRFQLLAMEDYDITIDNVVEGNLDIAVLPPVSYIKAKEREPGTQYIATIMRDEDGREYASYKGYMVALKSRYPGWTMDDFLKDPGKYTLALVTKSSSSGWAYPMAMMRKRGIDPDRAFKKVLIFANHPDVTDAVATGVADIGATWEYNFEVAKQKHGDVFDIVATTPDIPGLSWVASKRVPKEFVDKVRQLLIELNSSPELKAELLKNTPDRGWQVMDDSYYNSAREIVRYVREFK